MSRYELRVLLWSWGLMIDIGLSAYTADVEPSSGIRVGPRVWLLLASAAEGWDAELPYLLKGLRRVAPRFKTALSAVDCELVFVLDHLWFPLTDSQDDALELAVAGWAAEELGIADELAAVSFDRSANRYVIEFDESLWSDDL